ncbi:hypothetical protein BD408DRAFT_419591 [Parasitella parasitica]|nr:hypothetical protein BD408DRAFT_419591 [Parasitella parasitica]
MADDEERFQNMVAYELKGDEKCVKNVCVIFAIVFVLSGAAIAMLLSLPPEVMSG